MHIKLFAYVSMLMLPMAFVWEIFLPGTAFYKVFHFFGFPIAVLGFAVWGLTYGRIPRTSMKWRYLGFAGSFVLIGVVEIVCSRWFIDTDIPIRELGYLLLTYGLLLLAAHLTYQRTLQRRPIQR